MPESPVAEASRQSVPAVEEEEEEEALEGEGEGEDSFVRNERRAVGGGSSGRERYDDQSPKRAYVADHQFLNGRSTDFQLQNLRFILKNLHFML